MTCYFLPRHVHFCCVGEALVFLDLKQDDYTLVQGDAVVALRDISLGGCTNDPPSRSLAAIRELLEGGLLTTDRNDGRDVIPTSFHWATEQLVDLEASAKIRITSDRIYRFISACTSAAFQLRCRALVDIVNAVEKRKAKYSRQTEMSVELARELTTTFQRLRAFVPLDYLCLYDSLALIEFLAAYRLFPSWVFGVKLEPWAAHCWVQEGRLSFNEDIEEAAGYAPVMVI